MNKAKPFRREYAAAGHSTRNQGRDVVVADSAGFVDEAFAPQLARS